MPTTNTTITNLYCPKCGSKYEADKAINLCTCGAPLLVDYDYEKAAKLLSKESLCDRESTMWRYHELLPVFDTDNIVSLGEGGTQCLDSRHIGPSLGFKHLYFKDETTNPTGSFKARGLGMAVSKAKELGITKLIIPTAGNAGSALSAYSARAGLTARVIMPADSPTPFVVDCKACGAIVDMVEGTIKDCGEKVAELVKSEGWFSVATLKEPYRIEGKKTMGYELAEFFGFELPDVVIYPTGGGTGLIGMWKAFDEMQKMGWIGSSRPRMISVQSEGCAPMVKAFDEGADHAETWPDPHTIASGLRVPGAIGDFLILQAVRESGGSAVAVSEDEIIRCTRELATKEGIFPAPEDGAALAALYALRDARQVELDERIVVFLTGSGYKYLDTLEKII
ncbi:MAG TPA: threonine synthase [candidate division Zixibacteria bacterium]|nr:threonine synthase [candidate division Zixibacteria bacterium]